MAKTAFVVAAIVLQGTQSEPQASPTSPPQQASFVIIPLKARPHSLSLYRLKHFPYLDVVVLVAGILLEAWLLYLTTGRRKLLLYFKPESKDEGLLLPVRELLRIKVSHIAPE